MNPLIIYPLAVITIYYCWRVYAKWLASRERQLRERVAYMLWLASERCG